MQVQAQITHRQKLLLMSALAAKTFSVDSHSVPQKGKQKYNKAQSHHLSNQNQIPQ